MVSTDWLRTLFVTNRVVVFAMYGQVFFTLGVALAVQSMKHTRLHLGKYLRWLAAFGLTHGLVEWGYVFIPIQASYLPERGVEVLQWLQVILMVVSFVCLLHFGLRTMVRSSPFREPEASWIVVGALTALAFVLSMAPHTGQGPGRLELEIWARYLLAVPGAIAATLGILAAAREVRQMQLPRISRWLQVSAWSLAAYALLNLVTPEHHWFLAEYLNYNTVLDLVGVPAQIWRTLAGAGILYGMVRSLSVFQIETDRQLQAAERQKALEAERELAVMNQIAITLGRARDTGKVLGTVLAQLLPFLRCREGEIALRDAGSEVWHLAAHSAGQLPEPWAPSPLILAVAETGDVVIERRAEGRGVGIPIRVGRRLLAVAALYPPQPVELSQRELQVLDSLGTLIGVGLENSRLWAEVERKEAARTEWISRVISAQEEERRRISHELHDEAIQSLVLLCRRLDAIEAVQNPLPEAISRGLGDARRHVEELVGALRGYARDLRPPALDDLGLMATLRKLLDDLGVRTGVSWELQVLGKPRRLARDTELGLFRIAQEAIRNIQRHAHARHVSVEMDFTGRGATLRVRDDGRGMPDWASRPDLAASGRLGLLGMQERASLLGGDLVIESEPGHGTTLSVAVPVQPGRSRRASGG